MFDLAPIRTAEGKFVCNILPHKNLSRSQQHLMTEAPVCQNVPAHYASSVSSKTSFIENSSVIEKILRHLKLWAPPERPPPPRSSTTIEYDADFLA
jgi:hypothetical protein